MKKNKFLIVATMTCPFCQKEAEIDLSKLVEDQVNKILEEKEKENA